MHGPANAFQLSALSQELSSDQLDLGALADG
jgi:hypothetical protein